MFAATWNRTRAYRWPRGDSEPQCSFPQNLDGVSPCDCRKDAPFRANDRCVETCPADLPVFVDEDGQFNCVGASACEAGLGCMWLACGGAPRACEEFSEDNCPWWLGCSRTKHGGNLTQ